MRRRAGQKRARRIGVGCHALDAQRHRADDRPVSGAPGGGLRALHAERSGRVAGRAAGPATCCWSKATTTSPASSSISPSRPGRMPRSMSARSASAPPRTASRWCWSRPMLGQGVVGAPLSKYQRYHTRICRPIGLTDGRLRAGLHLRGRAHRLRLRRQEHLRPDALPVSAAGAAALAAAHDGARLRPSDPHHLLGADRAGVRARALSDPAEGHPAGKRDRAPRNSRNPPFLALRAARLRHLAVFRGGEADHRERLRLPPHGLGHCRTRRIARLRRRARWPASRSTRSPPAPATSRSESTSPDRRTVPPSADACAPDTSARHDAEGADVRRRHQGADPDVLAAVPAGAAQVDRAWRWC